MSDPNQSYLDYLANKALAAAAANETLTVQRANLVANNALLLSTAAQKKTDAVLKEIDLLQKTIASFTKETNVILNKETALETDVSSFMIASASLFGTQISGKVFASPVSGSGASSFRRLVESDLPTNSITFTNIGDHAPSLTGTGATGTWNINTLGTAVGIVGGAVNQIPYQSAPGVTNFINAPTVGNASLTWNGTNFVWAVGGGISVLNINNYAPGLTGIGAIGTWNISTSGTSTGIAGGAANQLLFQTSSGHTGYVIAPTVGNTTLTWNGSTFVWVPGGGGGITTTNIGQYAPSLTGAGASGTWEIDVTGTSYQSTYAVNINGGTLNQIPYQTKPGVTSFILAPTVDNTYLIWNGSSFVWVALGAASELAGGQANQIVYQTAPGATSFIIAPTTSGTYLEWDGSAFIWATPTVDLSNVLTTSNYMNYALPLGGGTLTGALNVTGAIVATGDITAFSDERLKTNWRPLVNDFVAKLANIKSGVFDRIDNKSTQIGVGAQSLQTLMPQAVKLSFNNMLSVNYGSAAMVSAIELAKEVVDLKTTVIELTERLNILADLVYKK